MNEFSDEDPLSKSERNRSNFVRELVQRSGEPQLRQAVHQATVPPIQIVQFWDDLDRLPQDVRACMDSWKSLEKFGYDIQIFDEDDAREFIRLHLGSRFANAFGKCYHPSMKSDYFRYSYIFVEGGFYIDADDVYHGAEINHLFMDGRLKLQPFCYDISTHQMVPPSEFLHQKANKKSWIFYFNTTPLIANQHHPIVERALLNATRALEQEELPEVQASTGPGNLTKSVFEILSDKDFPEDYFLVVHDWENISTSKWPLSYRNDKRNWRLSNREKYKPSSRSEG